MFSEPDFKSGSLEFRFEDEEICIYATKAGLERIIELCKGLLKNPDKGHIHLEDYEILTVQSKKCVIAVFDDKGRQQNLEAC